MKDTVVIVGSHPATMVEFDFNRQDCDIWVFNEALGKSDWCIRADAVFQLHKPIIWRSKTNRSDPAHYEWLKKTDVPVYMMDVYEDVPASIRYPIEDVLKLAQIKYLTSSVAYALALAVHQGYKRIEVYGVEMETQTEYEHQRVGVAYWLGIADGRGIEIDFHSKTMFNEPLYGYEGNTRIDMEVYKNRVEELDVQCKQYQEDYEILKADMYKMLDDFQANYKAGLPEIDNLIAKMGQAAHNYGQVDGARQTNKRYFDKCVKMIAEGDDYTIVKQDYESESNDAAKTYQAEMIAVHNIANVMKGIVNQLKEATDKFQRQRIIDEFKNILNAYVKHTTGVGVSAGVGMENRMLMQKYDWITTALGGAKALDIMREEMARE